jgi:SNF2 family DNA or RNA helicase
VTGRLRSESVRKFQTSPRTLYAWGNWKAAGVGITLHAAHNFAAFDFPWDPGTLWQGIDRIHRIGQAEVCNIYWIVAKDTLEDKLISILRKKTNIITSIIDTAEQKDEDLLSIFQELVKEANSDE